MSSRDEENDIIRGGQSAWLIFAPLRVLGNGRTRSGELDVRCWLLDLREVNDQWSRTARRVLLKAGDAGRERPTRCTRSRSGHARTATVLTMDACGMGEQCFVTSPHYDYPCVWDGSWMRWVLNEWMGGFRASDEGVSDGADWGRIEGRLPGR